MSGYLVYRQAGLVILPLIYPAVYLTSGACTKKLAHWRVTGAKDAVVVEDSQAVELGPDAHQKIRDFSFAVKEGESYTVVLDLVSASGKTLAHNVYDNPFNAQPRPRGFPERMDDELGMRLWWAGMERK